MNDSNKMKDRTWDSLTIYSDLFDAGIISEDTYMKKCKDCQTCKELGYICEECVNKPLPF